MRIFLGLLVAIVIAVAFGCGDDDDDGAAEADGNTADSGEDARTEAGTDGGGTETVYPVPDWAVEDPAEHGFDPDILQQAADWVGTLNTKCFVVTRDGVIVGEWYWNDWQKDSIKLIASASKSFTSALVGIAQDRGELNIDESASKYISEWVGTDSEAVTIKNLISNDSGRYWDDETDIGRMAYGADDKTQFSIDLPDINTPQQYEPGEHWDYNNCAIQTLERVLKNATGMDMIDYAQQYLLQPIGINAEWRRDQAANPFAFGGVQVSCRDLARFGYLYLREGMWADSEQIVSSQWVSESIRPSTDLNSAYGYLWWLNIEGPVKDGFDLDYDGQRFPGLPEEIYAALGTGRQILAIVPSERIVLTRIGEEPGVEKVAFDRALINNVLAALEGASRTIDIPEG
jgi:CubicO group peptidase (beta-lactamase class C family)